MSHQEKVTPGKVNSLISFFEHRGEENLKPHGNDSQTSDLQERLKLDMVTEYFSPSSNQQQKCSEADTDTTTVEKVQETHYASYQNEDSQIVRVNGNADHSQAEDIYPQLQSQDDNVEAQYRRESDTEIFYQRQDSHSSSSTQKEQEAIEKDKIQIIYQCQSDKQNADADYRADYREDDAEHIETHHQIQNQDELGYTLKEDEQNQVFEESCTNADIRVLKQDRESYSNQEDTHQDASYQLSEGIQAVQIDQQHVTHTQESEVSHIQHEEILQTQSENIEELNDYQGYIQSTQQSEHRDVDSTMYTIPYEMLPNHLKGFVSPTVFPAAYLDPDDDATCLKKAMKGLNTNEAAIIAILANRNLEQRLEIAASYEKLFQKNLVHELKKGLSGKLDDVIIAMVTPIYEYLATDLRRAVKGAGTDEDTLMEILCIYEDKDIDYIKDAYERLFKRTLKDDIYDDTSGDFRKILLSILAACREDPKASPASVAAQLCETDAKGKSTLDADTLRTVLVSYTRPFLYSVFLEYENIAGKSFDYMIKAICKGDVKNALLALYNGIVHLPGFFAQELNSAFKGMGFKESKVTRIVVSRSEIDLEDIKDAYAQQFGKSLEKEVQKETSGDYEKTVLALIEGCNSEEYRQALQTAESNL